MSLLELEELGYSSHGPWPRNVNANEFLPDAGMHIINVIVISPLILIIIKSPHPILIDSD